MEARGLLQGCAADGDGVDRVRGVGVAERDIDEPESLAEQLVTLADGAASRAMVLNDPDFGRHARAAAEILLDHALSDRPAPE